VYDGLLKKETVEFFCVMLALFTEMTLTPILPSNLASLFPAPSVSLALMICTDRFSCVSVDLAAMD